MGLVARKPVFGVSDKESFKPVSSATETIWKIEISPVASLHTVKSRLFERRLSETTGLFETMDSPDFSLLSIAIKLPIIRIWIIQKIQFFEVIRRSRLKKFLLNYP